MPPVDLFARRAPAPAQPGAASASTSFRLPGGSSPAARRGPAVDASRSGLRAAADRLATAAAAFLYPPACISCRAEVMTPHGLCADCWGGTRFIDSPLCRRCGAPVEGAEDAPFCDQCLGRPLSFDQARSALVYDGVGRRLALRLKHGDRLDLARPAGRWMARVGAPLLAEADLVAPVPLHWTRLMRRRFNQAAELARWTVEAADRREALAPRLLRRTRRTPSQRGMDRGERIANLAGAFSVDPRVGTALRGATVVVVDDVHTTGATFSACAEALRAAGAARVHGLSLARVDAARRTGEADD